MTSAAPQPLANPLSYLNGEWKPLGECLVPINTHALQYGTGCFEGIRGYWSGTRLNLLLLRQHFARLHRNAGMLLMSCPSVDEMIAIARDCVARNAPTQNVYLRPVVFKRGTSLGPVLVNVADGYMCYLQALGDYLDTSKGLNVCVSSWRRLADNAIPTRSKATGGYLNSALAKSEAVLNGFDEAIFLNDRNQVCEGSAENIFLVRDGVLVTPDRTADILEGITRQAILQLAQDLGIPVQERAVARTELYHADEIFLTGTGCQVSWVKSIDKRQVGAGARGPLTAKIQTAYENAVYGREPTYAEWLTAV
ncbi:MAG: branched-chain amino acid transaminase [Planctomycetes bacterium]|nr:branched-chain amino acid transaminase [Planctomycetota bacterium]